ncbi:MAG TPA: carboxypeptidase-like regulatory domain-containing protein [Pyrinomonadaceae bacterium]|jgi:hypothetical protein|nr:carboxypeptidase-like regulatory domain-containing protein [Pyrinomonadaceae bacterium]
MFRQFTILVLTVLIFARIPSAQNPIDKPPSLGTLKVVVMDVTGKPIPNAYILLETDHAALKCLSNQEGRCELGLPRDLYRVSIVSSEQFCWSRRAAIRLTPSTSATLNFILIEYQSVVPKGNGRELGDDEFVDTWGVNIQYESVPLPRPQSNVPEVGIQFGERTEKRRRIEYRADLLYSGHSLFGDQHPGVVVSYDTTTIYANVVRFDKRSFQFEAEGNVIIEDGKQRIRVRGAKLKFQSGVPTLEFIR